MTAEEVAAMEMNKGPDGDVNDKENVQTPVKTNQGSTNSASKRKGAPGVQLKATPAKKAKTGAPVRTSTSEEDDEEEDDAEDDG